MRYKKFSLVFPVLRDCVRVYHFDQAKGFFMGPKKKKKKSSETPNFRDHSATQDFSSLFPHLSAAGAVSELDRVVQLLLHN